jgi:osmotically inducible protein OsmC
MSKHHAHASWAGNLPDGKGQYLLKTSGLTGKLSFPARFEDNKEASSPEELIAAAHSSCFSMALAHGLSQEGFEPDKIETDAEVTLIKAGDSFEIAEITLKTTGKVPGVKAEKFLEIAKDAKENCPVSKALKAVKIKLEAKLL